MPFIEMRDCFGMKSEQRQQASSSKWLRNSRRRRDLRTSIDGTYVRHVYSNLWHAICSIEINNIMIIMCVCKCPYLPNSSTRVRKPLCTMAIILSTKWKYNNIFGREKKNITCICIHLLKRGLTIVGLVLEQLILCQLHNTSQPLNDQCSFGVYAGISASDTSASINALLLLLLLLYYCYSSRQWLWLSIWHITFHAYHNI